MINISRSRLSADLPLVPVGRAVPQPPADGLEPVPGVDSVGVEKYRLLVHDTVTCIPIIN